MSVWWLMALARQYSAPNVVGARKLKALICCTINHFYMKSGHFCIFEPLFGGLGATYTVHLRLIGKPVMDNLLVTIELFSLDAVVEALPANIDWK